MHISEHYRFFPSPIMVAIVRDKCKEVLKQKSLIGALIYSTLTMRFNCRHVQEECFFHRHQRFVIKSFSISTFFLRIVLFPSISIKSQ